MKFRSRYCLMATTALLAFDTNAAEPQELRADGEENVEEVVVTGTNMRGLPREYIASPVFTYSAKDMEESGLGALSEYIQMLPQNFIGDLSEAATTGVGFGTGLGGAVSQNQFDGFSAFSLRGLGSDATLTLLNGRRLPNAGMTETPTVSFIPAALIERLEIVPDGASATYGADAVGGVVNLVTRRDFDGLEMRVRGSTATEVDRDEYQVSLAAGHRWDGGNIYGSAALQDREPLVGDPVEVYGGDYEITATPDESVGSFFGGASQQFGAAKLSIDGVYFQSKRSAYQLTLPNNRRTFLTESDGYSLYSNLQWQAGRSTLVDVMLDYHENETSNETRRRGILQTARHHDNRLLSAEARAQTELGALPGGLIHAVGGFQYRRDTLRTDALIFFQHGGGEVEVSSAFAEAYFPLIGAEQAIPLVRSLVWSAAARYDDFGAPMGSKVSPKLGVRWGVNTELSVRGTYSQSFLTPRLRDRVGIAEQISFTAQPDAFLNPAEQDPRLPVGTSLTMFRAGSNPDLQPQDAKTFTVGFDYAPSWIENLDLGLGYYRIELTDRVARPFPDDLLLLSGLQTFTSRDPSDSQLAALLNNPVVNRIFASDVPFVNDGELIIFPSLAAVPAELISSVRVVADARTQNYASQRTDGIDLDLSYRRALLGGNASLRIRGQYILSLESQSAPGTPAVSRLGTIYNPTDLSLNATLGWQRGPLSIGSMVYHSGGFTDTRNGQNDAHIGSYTTASLAVGWSFAANHRSAWLADSSIALVVANVFDQQPPQIADEVLTYSPLNSPANPRTIALILNKRI
ncbi:TonB-dependent receptor plug domain-containing protein [Steroidobacter sp.]|uniref:TonB-dependent receptor plug domain-containing protein n=1 Tax=Steroidobacter sp. TaxID=1978227 RepID=UPI001A5FF8C7|nr:TonB-dependent receptor [Steroidobacter sp.]MBL8270971.1 TonB-dependent receptor [Steroidobacter sp.]